MLTTTDHAELSISEATAADKTNRGQTVAMSQRFTTEWLWYILALYAGSFWSPVTGRNPPNNPATVEAQAKFFQDFFSVQLSPYKIEFGHVCEDPNNWEQRYEKKDFKNHRDMGKVRWGDKKGGYGEHYWDLNHAGHNNDHDNDGYSDDGSYHEDNDSYDEPSNNSPSYSTEEYDPEPSYDETNRNKRAYPKVKVYRKTVESNEGKADKEPLQAAASSTEILEQRKPLTARNQQRPQHKPHDDVQKEKQQFVLVVNHKNTAEESQHDKAQQDAHKTKHTHFVPYESGAGVRQHQAEEATAAASIPRLFLEPSTGHVVDRATGQAYVLQPITKYN